MVKPLRPLPPASTLLLIAALGPPDCITAPVGKPDFSKETLTEHRGLKISSFRHLSDTSWLVILSSPLIYVCAVPFLLLDAAVALYQAVCFPIYRIPKVARADYLVFDRGRLSYLNSVQKVACVYCSYANGLLAYISEIAARTEQHFCPIKHAQRSLQLHSRYPHFLPYGDARAYREQSEAVSADYSDLIQIGNKKP